MNVDPFKWVMVLGIAVLLALPGFVAGALLAFIVWLGPFEVSWAWAMPWIGGGITLAACFLRGTFLK